MALQITHTEKAFNSPVDTFFSYLTETTPAGPKYRLRIHTPGLEDDDVYVFDSARERAAQTKELCHLVHRDTVWPECFGPSPFYLPDLPY